MTTADAVPQIFRDAVDSMHAARLRGELSLGEIRAPQKLAPYSHAVGIEVLHDEAVSVPEVSEGDAFGRLILLHDPRSGEDLAGLMRMVAYIQADMDAAVAEDPLLPQVAWEWLTESLECAGATYDGLGGTVTTTNSVRYGEIGGPGQAFQLELRASWTAGSANLTAHVEAFADVLAHVAGLPPEGVAILGR